MLVEGCLGLMVGLADTCLAAQWSFWGHVSWIGGVESSTWPWHGTGQGPASAGKGGCYAHTLREAAVSPPPCASRVLFTFPSV